MFIKSQTCLQLFISITTRTKRFLKVVWLSAHNKKVLRSGKINKTSILNPCRLAEFSTFFLIVLQM